MLFAIPESISGIFFGLIPFKATGSHLSEIQCTVTIKIPQDALLVKLIYLIFLISFAYYLFIFVKILDAPTRFCYTGSSYKEDLSKMMDINYELYKVFYYVAISLSFSDASKQLFISQSAVSQSVKVLEKKLGITLFIRSTKRVQLTPEGETLLRHIEPAMNLIKRGEAQIMEASNLGGGQLRIGASDTICHQMCGSSGNGTGRPDCHQLSELPVKSWGSYPDDPLLQGLLHCKLNPLHRTDG